MGTAAAVRTGHAASHQLLPLRTSSSALSSAERVLSGPKKPAALKQNIGMGLRISKAKTAKEVFGQMSKFCFFLACFREAVQ